MSTKKQNKMIVGSKVIWGCDIAEVCSIIINDFVMIKVEHNNKIENVHIDNIEFFESIAIYYLGEDETEEDEVYNFSCTEYIAGSID